MDEKCLMSAETKNEDTRFIKLPKVVTFDDIKNANSCIVTTNIKGKDYAEVNQRIKAYRMIYPSGTLRTVLEKNENGICIFRAYVYDDTGRLLATGTAQEKEDSSFINETSYIENCETSALGRALGIAGFGIDTSIASAEEVANAIANQNKPMTKEEALKVKLSFGKYKNKTMEEILKVDKEYLEWLLSNSKNEKVIKCCSIVLEKKAPSEMTEEEQKDNLQQIRYMNDLFEKMEEIYPNFKREEVYHKYGVNEQKDLKPNDVSAIIKILEKKINEN